MYRILLSLLLVLVSASVARAQEAPSYAKHIRPFLAKYCLECHNAKSKKAGLDLETYKTMLEGSDGGKVLIAGKADESLLVKLAEAKDKTMMPPKEAKYRPTAEEVKLLRVWVAAGAKDDSANVVVALPEIKPRGPVHHAVRALAYDSAGQTLAAGTGRAVWLFDAWKGAPLHKLDNLPGDVTALAWHKDRLAVACGLPGQAGEVRVYRTSDWQTPEKTLKGHKDAVLSLEFSPDGLTLATAGYDRLVLLWDVASGEIRHALKDHSDAVHGLAYHPKGTYLATCGADRTVKIWDPAQGKLRFTLSEATDWLYTVAWSPEGTRLAAGGVDKSIRLWDITPQGTRLTRSAFAHEGPVLRLAFDGQVLYSLGEDRVIKQWSLPQLAEGVIFKAQQEAALSLAFRPKAVKRGQPKTEEVNLGRLAVGRFDGVLLVYSVEYRLPETTPAKLLPRNPLASQPKPKDITLPAAPFTETKEQEPNNSPAGCQLIKLPVSITGSINQAGDTDYFRFEAKKGQEIGVQLVAKTIKSKLDGYLELTDERGTVLTISNEGHLGFICPEAGVYALGVRDREFRGGAEFPYRLDVGDIPVITSVFPLGVSRGVDTTIQLEGVHLPQRTVRVKAPLDAAPGSKVALKVTTPRGDPLGSTSVTVGEFPESLTPGRIIAPATANGRIQNAGATNSWKFDAKKGQRLIVEVEARRHGSPLDSFIEILDAKGQSVPRATLRSLARTYSVFRDHDSAGANIRIEAWSDFAINDYLLVGGELMKIRELPTHPDADCIFFSEKGQRRGFLDTTPTHHAMGVSMYKVALHPPGTSFPPNGFPVTTLYYKNDDGGPGFGRDSRLTFDTPADGEYQVRISDARGQGGKDFGYRLTVRPPRPSFNISVTPATPSVWKGGAIPLTVSADRIDDFNGDISLRLEGLPPGFSAPATRIGADSNSTAFALSANPQAPTAPQSFKVIAEATIDGKKVTRQVTVAAPTVKETGDIGIITSTREVVLKPGTETRLTVTVERRKGFAGRIPLEVRGLPHGVRVLDLGLNGILITERETVRTIVLYAEPWVQALDQPFVVLARQEGKNAEYAAESVLLKVK